MALLLHMKTNEKVALEPQSLVGRADDCVVQVDTPKVSKAHARVVWNGQNWQIRDLGSRNGTWLNGERLAPGEDRSLDLEDALAFADPKDAWRLVDAAPPPACARNEAGDRRIYAKHGLLQLPSSDKPLVTIYEGPDGNWRMEINSVIAPVTDGQTIEVDEQRWHLELAPIVEPTWEEAERGLRLGDLSIHFTVSRDEERVRVELAQGDRRVAIPQRSFHYMLLTLARRRLADTEAGHPVKECGWIDREELYRMLRTDRERFNKDVSRARRQLAEFGVLGAQGLIEVWGDSRRLGVARIVIDD